MSDEAWMGPLTALYGAYIAKVEQLERNAKPGAGWFGLPGGPKNDSCHGQFADQVRTLIGDLAAQGPTSAQARQALDYIFRAPEAHKDSQSLYWMLQAVHGMTEPLIACLDRADAQALFVAYAGQYRRWERLPAHRTALAALDRARNK